MAETPQAQARVQTNVQLHQQMRAAGYPPEALALVLEAYGLAQQLFSARFRASGKPFLCHLVGTAGDLAAEQVPADVVAAGLLHAAYEQGDFGYVFRGHRRSSPRKRRWLAERIGPVVEEHVYRYSRLPWDPPTITGIRPGLAHCDDIQRGVVTMRLANEVDDYRDLGVLHGRNPEKRLDLIRSCGAEIVAIASELGCRHLAEELASAFRACLKADLSQLPRSPHDRSFLLPPASYRRSPALVLRNALAKLKRRVLE